MSKLKNKNKVLAGRILLYFVFVLSGLALFYYSNTIYCIVIDHVKYLDGNAIFASALAILLLTFSVVTFNWILKNHDQLQQFEDTKQQQTETLFSNALQLLFKQDDIQANSVGLKELIRLRQATEDDVLKKRIDLITSSGLQLPGAKLQGANLQEADLREANLNGAYLQGANLQGAIMRLLDPQEGSLRETKLGFAMYDDQTKFSEGFNPKEHGMMHEDDFPKKPNNH